MQEANRTNIVLISLVWFCILTPTCGIIHSLDNDTNRMLQTMKEEYPDTYEEYMQKVEDDKFINQPFLIQAFWVVFFGIILWALFDPIELYFKAQKEKLREKEERHSYVQRLIRDDVENIRRYGHRRQMKDYGEIDLDFTYGDACFASRVNDTCAPSGTSDEFATTQKYKEFVENETFEI